MSLMLTSSQESLTTLESEGSLTNLVLLVSSADLNCIAKEGSIS